MAIGTKNGQLPRKLLFARDRIVIKTDDFPVGTTELIYRITLLDDNQKIANSLVSLLKQFRILPE
jgi:hypothetical protein